MYAIASKPIYACVDRHCKAQVTYLGDSDIANWRGINKIP